MKKLLFTVLISFVTVISISYLLNTNKDLYNAIDFQIENLNYSGFFGISQTVDNYTVTSIGRIVLVKINKAVPDKKYKKLAKSICKKYKNNPLVSTVFINNLGIITIDCRK